MNHTPAATRPRGTIIAIRHFSADIVLLGRNKCLKNSSCQPELITDNNRIFFVCGGGFEKYYVITRYIVIPREGRKIGKYITRYNNAT